ncbi:hypothetical protein GOP47_0020876 [Adiantum capillus-veneris]|uniref:RPM1 interacting protein 13 n=1 Tax=Adiantum capillus-veneris TaxID=13818 RepID=A0A9D4UA04_ADICA|nr:hypothetical protein GOP47_0020876 [Adiantum capillus-veneris]
MGSEIIVLSSDDEDDDWLAVKFKRSKIPRLDAEVMVIDKTPSIEAKTPEENNSDCSKVAQGKLPEQDDCVVLSSDPENTVQLPDFQANDADDLVVVGERGSVACRDFPHARHLCVKFPYANTPHEKHCEQCHCYVCDIIAPCLHWGHGRQSSDHCHAIDKDDKWRKLRTQARFRLSKLSSRPQVTAQREQSTQPQLRMYTQPPLRVTLTTGLKGSTYPANTNANSASFHQRISSLSDVSANWQPYFPSSQSTMPVNGSFNSHCVGNFHNSFITTVNRGRVFTEHRSPIVNVATATVTSPVSQPGSHQQRLISIHAPLMNTPNGTHRQATMSTSIPAPQQGAHLPNFVNAPTHPYQDQRTGSFSAVPYDYVQNICTSTERTSARPPTPPLSNFNKDLTTLQSYLMEGISGEPQSQSNTSHESNVNDTGRLQSSGDSVLQGQFTMAHHGPMEPLYSPFEPSEVRASDNTGANLPAVQTENISQQIDNEDRNTPLDGARSKKVTEQPIIVGGETDNSSLLDHILAGFDDEFWTLLEPTYPGF